MSVSNPAKFLNLDLVLRAPVDLEALAEYFGDSVFLLYKGAAEGAFLLALEPSLVNADPETCLGHLLELIERLPEDLRDLWDRCTSKAFDFGFDGGFAAPSFTVQLPPALLGRIARLGGEIHVTVYPFHDDEGAAG